MLHFLHLYHILSALRKSILQLSLVQFILWLWINRNTSESSWMFALDFDCLVSEFQRPDFDIPWFIYLLLSVILFKTFLFWNLPLKIYNLMTGSLFDILAFIARCLIIRWFINIRLRSLGEVLQRWLIFQAYDIFVALQCPSFNLKLRHSWVFGWGTRKRISLPICLFSFFRISAIEIWEYPIDNVFSLIVVPPLDLHKVLFAHVNLDITLFFAWFGQHVNYFIGLHEI